jgi:NAD(P)-dependent dehydrogenase (short-subunit alcohol dehydrogenase family)
VPTALITGASTGIGRATALRLARSGWTVLAGVREQRAGERLAAEAAGEGEGRDAAGNGGAPGASGRLTPLALDVTDAAQIAAAAELVARSAPGGALDALVNNAGVAIGGPLETLPLVQLRELLEVNLIGQVAVTQALIPALRRARGRIVLLSSIGGRLTTPYMYPYHASKYALEAVGDALRVELARSHIRVALIEPGAVATPIWTKGSAFVEGVSFPEDLHEFYGHVPAAVEKSLSDTARRGIAPERVAQTIERALTARRPRARYLVGADARAMVWVKRLLPDHLFDRVIARAVGV